MNVRPPKQVAPRLVDVPDLEDEPDAADMGTAFGMECSLAAQALVPRGLLLDDDDLEGLVD